MQRFSFYLLKKESEYFGTYINNEIHVSLRIVYYYRFLLWLFKTRSKRKKWLLYSRLKAIGIFFKKGLNGFTWQVCNHCSMRNKYTTRSFLSPVKIVKYSLNLLCCSKKKWVFSIFNKPMFYQMGQQKLFYCIHH